MASNAPKKSVESSVSLKTNRRRKTTGTQHGAQGGRRDTLKNFSLNKSLTSRQMQSSLQTSSHQSPLLPSSLSSTPALSPSEREVEEKLAAERIRIAGLCDRWEALLKREGKKEAAVKETVSYYDWLKRRHGSATTGPRSGICLRHVKPKANDADLRATRRKFTRFDKIDDEFNFKFSDMKREPKVHLTSLRRNDEGEFHFDAAKVSPVFFGQWFTKSVPVEEAELAFNPQERHPASFGYMFQQDIPLQVEQKISHFNPKTCTRKELTDVLLLPMVMKHLSDLMRLNRYEEKFVRKRGKVNGVDFLAFRLCVHNANHPERLQVPLPKCISDVTFFEDISITDLSCDSRCPSPEALLEQILNQEEQDSSQEKTGNILQTSRHSLLKNVIEEFTKEEQLGACNLQQRNSFLERCNSETFRKMAWQYNTGEVYYYKDLLQRQVEKEDLYRQGHKYTRRNRFYRVYTKDLTREEAAIIIQKTWRGYEARKDKEIQELRQWQREWKVIQSLFDAIEDERRLEEANKPPKVEEEQKIVEKEYQACNCDPESCDCPREYDPTRSVWQRPPTMLVPDPNRERDMTMEIDVEGEVFQFGYLECGQFSEENSSLLFLHGFTQRKCFWRPVTEFLTQTVNNKLTKGQHMVALDLPGHGRSSLLAFDLSDLSCLVASLHCFIANSVLSGSRLHIVGHALGASLALLYAEKWPEVVAQLTVIAPVLTTYPRASALHRGLRFNALDDSTIRSFVVPETMDDLELLLNHFFHGPEMASLTQLEMQAWLDKIWPKRKTYLNIFNAALRNQNEVNRALPNIRSPTLILWGLHDHFVDVCGARILEKQIPARTRVKVFFSSGHGVASEAAEGVAAEIADFHQNRTEMTAGKSRIFY